VDVRVIRYKLLLTVHSAWFSSVSWQQLAVLQSDTGWWMTGATRYT